MLKANTSSSVFQKRASTMVKNIDPNSRVAFRLHVNKMANNHCLCYTLLNKQHINTC